MQTSPVSAPSTTRCLMALCLAALTLALLAACGGGGDAQPDRTIGPPDCINRPELCQ